MADDIVMLVNNSHSLKRGRRVTYQHFHLSVSYKRLHKLAIPHPTQLFKAEIFVIKLAWVHAQ